MCLCAGISSHDSVRDATQHLPFLGSVVAVEQFLTLRRRRWPRRTWDFLSFVGRGQRMRTVAQAQGETSDLFGDANRGSALPVSVS